MAPELHPRALLGQAFRVDRLLTLAALALGVLLVVALAGLVFDSRVITGAPAWLKPAKFAVSFAIYCLTVVWLLHFVQGRRWIVRTVAAITALVAVVEVPIIALQAARGTTSHFNEATELDSLLFSIMGAAIFVLLLMAVVLEVLLMFQRFPNAAFAWSIRLGLLVSLLGMALGFLMTAPTAAQRARMDAGEKLTIVGAHSVGVEDGGPGLPVVGWSTEGGDVRPAHFVGVHALQILPLLGWLITLRGRRLGPGHQLALVFLAAVGYQALVALLAWQALRGQPIVAPDSATLTALALLALCVALGAGSIVRHGSSPHRSAREG